MQALRLSICHLACQATSSDYAAELMERDQRGGVVREGGRRGRPEESNETSKTKLPIYSADSVLVVLNWCLAIDDFSAGVVGLTQEHQPSVEEQNLKTTL